LAFGQDPNTLESKGDQIQKHLGVIFPVLAWRALIPIHYWRVVPNFRLDRAVREIRKSVDGLIEKAQQKLAADPAGAPNNLLEALLRAAATESGAIDNDVVRANVVTMLLAGEDTTAHALAWTMYYLAENQDLQSTLQKEARELLGDARLARDYQATDKLKLFEYAAREALRFRPVTPLLGLETKENVELEGIWLPAGTQLYLCLRPAMLDEANFPNANEFVPERWATAGRHNAHAFLQFGAGPRVCPGRALANREIRTVLSMVCRNFNVEFAGDREEIREEFAFTMRPNKLPLRFRQLV
jgi:cytochrome P450